jgi:hypothetical protein
MRRGTLVGPGIKRKLRPGMVSVLQYQFNMELLILIKKERIKICLSCRWLTHPHQRSREPYNYVWRVIIQFYCALHNNLPFPSSKEHGILNALANTFKNNILTIYNNKLTNFHSWNLWLLT